MDCHFRNDLHLLDLRGQQCQPGPQLHAGYRHQQDLCQDQSLDDGHPMVHHPPPADRSPHPRDDHVQTAGLCG